MEVTKLKKRKTGYSIVYDKKSDIWIASYRDANKVVVMNPFQTLGEAQKAIRGLIG